MPMETQSEALQRLTAAGYPDEYQAESDGLRCMSSKAVHFPETFRVDEVVRFEGDSDPNEESAVFAISSRVDGAKGTYTVAFGTLMDPLDTEMVRRLR